MLDRRKLLFGAAVLARKCLGGARRYVACIANDDVGRGGVRARP